MIQDKDELLATKYGSLHSFPQRGKNYELVLGTKGRRYEQSQFVTWIKGYWEVRYRARG